MRGYICTGVSRGRCGVDGGKAGLVLCGVGSVGGVAHIAQDFGRTTGCFPVGAIIGSVPGAISIRHAIVGASLRVVGGCLVKPVVACLSCWLVRA